MMPKVIPIKLAEVWRRLDSRRPAPYLNPPCPCVRVPCRRALLRPASTNAPQPPCGEEWVHEIKHDGFRVIARKEGKRVKLYSRPGNDLTYRFSLIVEALAGLRARSCISQK